MTNADTGQPICDATVTATGRAYGEKLFAVGCTYTGAYERAGLYVVRASREGYTPKEVAPVKVVMGGGDCPTCRKRRLRCPSRRPSASFRRPPPRTGAGIAACRAASSTSRSSSGRSRRAAPALLIGRRDMRLIEALRREEP
ncbi:MAG: carboxypeptidase-like regulatory domain-containing protein [Vicinamibacteria bacterium]